MLKYEIATIGKIYIEVIDILPNNVRMFPIVKNFKSFAYPNNKGMIHIDKPRENNKGCSTENMMILNLDNSSFL